MADERIIQGKPLNLKPLSASSDFDELFASIGNAFNGARLKEAAKIFVEKMLADDVTVIFTVAGALTPGGYGITCLAPLIEAGFIDLMIITGANLYHDIHFLPDSREKIFQAGSEVASGAHDEALKKEGIIRIYDLLFKEDVLFSADKFVEAVLKSLLLEEEEEKEKISSGEEKSKSKEEKKRGIGDQVTTNSSAYLNYWLGGCLLALLKKDTDHPKTLLETAYDYGVPLYSSSPGDSSIGMMVAKQALLRKKFFGFDVSRDVNELAAFVHNAQQKGKAAIFILGGGSPKNFGLQTEPYLSQILGLENIRGFDYFVQITDARPDTGGLSGATPKEAVSWGKVDPKALPGTSVVYCDVSIALPLITFYALKKKTPRSQKKLYYKRDKILENFRKYVKDQNKKPKAR